MIVDGERHIVDEKDTVAGGKGMVVDDGKGVVVDDGKGMIVDKKDMAVDDRNDMAVNDGEDTIVDGKDTVDRDIVQVDPEVEPVAMDVDDPSIKNSKEESHLLSSPTQCGSSIVNARSRTVFQGVEEGKAPLWVKWRGKWRAGVQCSLEDCPAQTVQAMPTYGRKSYILVFFPKNRSFVWTDWQLTCCISENPQPLSFGTHKSGRSSVLGSNIAKTFMLRKLATAMLDISDELPVTAVKDCARDVRFWKDVANEAEQTSTYQELGTVLVKIKSMILSSVIEGTWNNARFQEWEHECRKAETAGSLELLVKELRNAVCWDEVEKLWGEYEQENLVTEWQYWKKRLSHDPSHQEKPRCDSFRQKTLDASVSFPEGSEGHGESDNGGNRESEQDNKRLKLAHEAVSDLRGSQKGMSVDLETGKNVDRVSSLNIIDKTKSLGSVLLNCKMGVEANPESKSSKCVAFSKRRKRQCNRYAKGGSIYCYKHIPSSNEEPSVSCTNEETTGKLPVLDKLPLSNICGFDGDVGVCSGITKYGRRCRLKARDGSIFCSMHTLHDLENFGKMLAIEMPLTKSGSSMRSKLATSAEDIIAHPKEKIEKMDEEQMNLPTQGTSYCVPKSTCRNRNTERCIGFCGTGAQCSHRARLGSSYCEKHTPGSSPYAQRGQEKAQCKEFSGKTPNNKQEVDISMLMNLIHDYVTVRLSKTESQSNEHSMSNQQMIDMVLKEVSGNLKASEALYELVSTEMEDLKQRVKGNDFQQVQDFLVPRLQRSINETSSRITIDEEKSTKEEDLSQVHIISVTSRTGPIDHTNSPTMTANKENCIEKKDQSQVENCHDPFLGETKSLERLSNVELLKQVSSAPNGHFATYTCKLCTQEFIDVIVLGQHWRECHNKEAQQYFRGYSCQYCSEPFRNKKGLYRHRKACHAEMVSQTKASLIAACIVCNGQFVRFENLWQHVVSTHPEQLFAFWPVTDPSVGLVSGFLQFQSSGLEIANVNNNTEKSVTNVGELQSDINIAAKDISCKVIASKVVGNEANMLIAAEEKQPSGVEETEKRTSAVEDTERQPSGVEETGKQTSGVEETGKQPSGVEETEKQPFGVKETGKQRCRVQETGKQRCRVQETEKQPSGVKETGKQHCHVQETEEPPSHVHERAEQTSGVKEAAKHPSVVKGTLKQLFVVEATAKQPSVVEATAKQPSVVEATAKQPSVVEATVKQPSVVEETEKQPSVVEETAKQPSIVQRDVKQRFVGETTKEISAVEETVKQCSVVEESTKQLSAVKKSRKKLPVVEESIKQLSVAKTTKQATTQLIDVDETVKKLSVKKTTKQPSCDLPNELKFKCKVCGLRFPLLPDLGRHHQAEHKPPQPIISKNIAEESLFMEVSEDLKPFIGTGKEKKKPQKLNIRRAPPNGKVNTEVHTVIEDERARSIIEREVLYSGKMLEGISGSRSLEIKTAVLDNHVSLETLSFVEDKSCHKMILCEDLSFGKERIPIPCVLDSNMMGTCTCSICVDNPDDHLETLTPWLQFSYVTKRTLNPSLGLDRETSCLGCCCQGDQCLPTKCEHGYIFDNENSNVEGIHGKSMPSRFPYDDRGCSSVEEGHLLHECNSQCNCSEDCPNRVLQKGVQLKLEVYKTWHKGWAVRATQHIARGTFICEYIGEVVDADSRVERYNEERCNYVYDVNAHFDIGHTRRSNQIFIDATKFGNVARFINHSCCPNLVDYQVLVESMDRQLAHIGLYAAHDIQVGEELSYDYCHELAAGEGTPCHCGAKDCRGRLN